MVNKRIRQGVIESLPEAKEIGNLELREKVYDAWAMSLAESKYARIEDIPPSGGPDTPPLKVGTQTDHLRSVARMAVAIAKDLQSTFKGFDVDVDEVIAGGLLHDLGKPFEFDSGNQVRWKSNPGASGWPSFRHSVYGAHIALSVGLPERIAHIVGAHSKEGQFIERSVVATIVHYADHCFWLALEKGNLLKT